MVRSIDAPSPAEVYAASDHSVGRLGEGILAAHPESEGEGMMTRESEGRVPGQQQAIGMSFSLLAHPYPPECLV